MSGQSRDISNIQANSPSKTSKQPLRLSHVPIVCVRVYMCLACSLFVDCDTVGVNIVAPGNQLFPREEYTVDYNQYKLPAAAKLVDIGQGKPDDSERYKTLAELRAAASGRWIEGWEDHGSDTVQIGEGFQANESFADWRKEDINQHTIIQYDPCKLPFLFKSGHSCHLSPCAQHGLLRPGSARRTPLSILKSSAC